MAVEEKRESSLLKKLKSLKDTQDEIQGLSSWCLSKGAAKAQKIIVTWSRAFSEGMALFVSEIAYRIKA
jgi:hypothetical protein